MRQREYRFKGPEAGEKNKANARGVWGEEAGDGQRPDHRGLHRTFVLIQQKATLSKIPSDTTHNRHSINTYESPTTYQAL